MAVSSLPRMCHRCFAGAITDGRFGVMRVAALGYLIAAVGYALLTAESRPTLCGPSDPDCARGWRSKVGPQSIATRLFAAEPGCDRGLTLIYLLANVSALVKSGHR